MTAKGVSKPRISRKARTFLEAMVFEGLSRPEAAEKAGFSDNWGYQILRRPECLRLKDELMEVLRTSAAARTIFHAEKLMTGAESEHVKMSAIEYLNPAISRSENFHLHQHNVELPGLTIIYKNAVDGDGKEIVGEALDISVPHPALNDSVELPDGITSDLAGITSDKRLPSKPNSEGGTS